MHDKISETENKNHFSHIFAVKDKMSETRKQKNY